MKKYKFFLALVAIFFFSVIGFTQEVKSYESPMSMYKDNFFLAGDKEDQVKFQFSAKYNIFYPSNTGIFMGYTQLSHWFIYEGRDTFYSMYQPEAFYRFESANNPFNNLVIPYVDYFQISPIYHCSTGVEGPDHRSVNEYYGQVQVSAGDVYNVGANVRLFGYYTINKKNKDINDYRHNYEADFFFKLRSKEVLYMDKEEVHCKIGGNPLGKGFVETSLMFRLLTSYIQPKLYIQYFCGYDQYMVDYNKKDTSLRIGLIF